MQLHPFGEADSWAGRAVGPIVLAPGRYRYRIPYAANHGEPAPSRYRFLIIQQSIP
jgi:hypothetical protein